MLLLTNGDLRTLSADVATTATGHLNAALTRKEMTVSFRLQNSSGSRRHRFIADRRNQVATKDRSDGRGVGRGEANLVIGSMLQQEVSARTRAARDGFDRTPGRAH
jgi:hypothetical protein